MGSLNLRSLNPSKAEIISLNATQPVKCGQMGIPDLFGKLNL